LRTDPLFVLGPARSFTTVVAAMLGQHPQLYGFPETHLLAVSTMEEWWEEFGNGVLSHGLLRLVAEVVLGRQDATSIEIAQLWLQRRLVLPTFAVFDELATNILPRAAVDKSPLITQAPYALSTVHDIFPSAFYLHLTRHPLAQGQSVLALLREVASTVGEVSPLLLAAMQQRRMSIFVDMVDWTFSGPVLDPQFQWYQTHTTILAFLDTVPAAQQMRVRGEDVIADPDHMLSEIASWLMLRTDSDAIDAMKHPEHSPFACFGPHNARFGGDPNFLRNPRLQSSLQGNYNLKDPLPWRPDGIGFQPEVRDLAAFFGYS
jgi:hypothetical protein